MKPIRNTVIVGMGALGMLFAGLITDRLGTEAVVFAADTDRVKRYRDMQFSINGMPRSFAVRDSRECGPADLVIVAVKYNALPSALDIMAPCVGPDTTIISVMNGITSEKIIGERFGAEKLIYCIAQGMDAVKFGGALNYSRPGELRIGIQDKADAGADNAPKDDARAAHHVTAEKRLQELAAYFDRAGVPYTVDADIMHRLWGKFMLNVGLNQTCMAYETNYGGILLPGEAHDTMVEAMREVIAVAASEGIRLTEDDLNSYIDLIRTLSPEGMPSMRQDGIAHRHSEVEMFAGTILELAGRHQIPVPVNERLYRRIKEMEASW